MAGLQEFTEYEVRAQACSGKGASGWSRPLRVLTRQRAVEGSCDCGLYRWTQTRAEPSIHVAVSQDYKPHTTLHAIVRDTTWGFPGSDDSHICKGFRSPLSQLQLQPPPRLAVLH